LATPTVNGSAAVATNVSGIDLSGPVYMACGGTLQGSQTVTVAGVTFGPIQNSHFVSLTGTQNNTWGNVPPAMNLGSDANDVALANLLEDMTYGVNTITWNLPGGQSTYEVQVLTENQYFSIYPPPDGRTSDLSVTVHAASGSPTADVIAPSNVTMGPNAFAVSTFTIANASDATSFTLNLSYDGGGNDILNAVIVSTPTPEPATMALLALGGIGALIRRRK
jgi:hypothetical protein